MRLLGHMVTRNEASRFLERSLASLSRICSDVAVFDDASTDQTIDIASAAGARVDTRDADEVAFAGHEGHFRNLAWKWMEEALKPEEGDWILSLDADEIALVDDADALYRHLVHTDSEALTVRIHELWKLNPPMERTDGFWGTITGARLYRWRPGASIPLRDMASGSIPEVARTALGTTTTLRIAHLGYVRQEDRVAKHSRYANRRGHSPTHVASILKRPTLQPLDGAF